MNYQGLAWCHVPADGHPLHLTRLLHANGRWNDPAKFGCLYLSTEPAGAIAEYQKALATGEANGDYHLASVQIRHLAPVADLTQPFTEFPAVDTRMMTSEDAEALRRCHDLAEVARDAGYTGLLVPSAALPGAVDLVVYFDVLGPAHVDLDDGPHRSPLRETVMT
jgi:RES domain-containing protein